MKLEYLLERELFFESFSNFLRNFTLNRFGCELGNIEVSTSVFSLYKAKYIVNKNLGFIAPIGFPQGCLRKLTQDYSYGLDSRFNILRRIYVFLATSHFFRAIFASHFVIVSDYPTLMGCYCVIPGNHSYKMFDQKTNSFEVFAKEEFDEDFIRNEIYIRKAFPFLSFPPFTLHTDGIVSYREEFVDAISLNRLKSKALQISYKDRALFELKKLHLATSELTNTFEYLDKIRNEFDVSIRKLPIVFDDTIKAKIQFLFDELIAIVRLTAESEMWTCMSHGDFQTGNILINEQKDQLYIIDWEYAGRRSQFYDIVTFHCGLRSNLDDNEINACVNEVDGAEGILNAWQLDICLLEDVLVKIRERGSYIITKADQPLLDYVSNLIGYLDKHA